MNFQFRAVCAAVHRPFPHPVPSSDPTPDAGYNHLFHLPTPLSDPATGNSLPSHLPVPSSDTTAGNSRPSPLPVPSSDTAAGYFALQALRVGLTGDAAAAPPSSREIQKARIRAKILAEEASQARILEEEVRRELEYERGVTERLSEVQSLGLLPPMIIPAQYLQPPQKAPAQHLLQPLLSQHLPRETGPAQPLFLPPRSQHLPQPTAPAEHLLLPPPPPRHLQLLTDPVQHVKALNNLWSGDEPPSSFVPHHLDSRFLAHNPDVQSPLDRPPAHHLPLRYGADGLTDWPSFPQETHHLAEIAVSYPSHSDFNGKRKHGRIAPSGPICYECGEEGHLSRVCKATIEARVEYKKGKTAMAAKHDVTQEIHHNKPADMEKPWVDPNQTCYMCGNKGHWSRVCTASMEVRAACKKSRTELPRKRKKCKQCGKKDHLPNACNASMEARDAYKKHKRMKARGEAAKAAATKIKEHECYKCGEMGHWSRTCKATWEARAVYKKKMDEINQAAKAAAAKIKEQECYKCGEMGHWSRTCKATWEARAVYKKKMGEINQAAAESQV